VFVTEAHPPGRSSVRTRDAVERLLSDGASQNEVARRLGVSKSTVAYHARRLGRPVDERCNRRYDWTEVQRYYDLGHSVTECVAHFGFSRETWNSARKRGDVTARPIGKPLEQLLVEGATSRFNLKRRILATGLKENQCESCGLTSWRGEPIAMALHHVNGDGDDNRLENLRLVCPNCHSQTDNFAGRNRVRVRLVDGDAAA
jgi:transposase-like protein